MKIECFVVEEPRLDLFVVKVTELGWLYLQMIEFVKYFVTNHHISNLFVEVVFESVIVLGKEDMIFVLKILVNLVEDFVVVDTGFDIGIVEIVERIVID